MRAQTDGPNERQLEKRVTGNRLGRRGARLALSAAWFLIVLILMMGLFEVALRMAGYGRPSERLDLFYGFEGSNPIYNVKVEPDGERMYVPAPNKPEFDQHFPVLKPPGTYRIFTFGGSTARGVPWNHRGSFSWWLEHYLQEAYPDRKIEVINLGMSGAGTTRELRNLKEAVGYKPDLFVVYNSQNEYLDAGFYPVELTRPVWIANIMKTLLSSRAVYFIYYRLLVLKAHLTQPRVNSTGAKMIEKILAEPFSPHSFQSFDYYRVPRMKTNAPHATTRPSEDRHSRPGLLKRILMGLLGKEGVEVVKNILGRSKISDEEIFANFDRNIRRMAEIAQKNHIKILFLAKAQNPKRMKLLSEYSVREDTLRPGTLGQWRNDYEEGIREIKAGQCRKAIKTFGRVQSYYLPEFNDSDSLLNLYMGECYEKLGRYTEARKRFEKRLKDSHDQFNQIMKDTAMSFDIPVIDIQELLTRHAPNGIIGYNVFVDIVHMRRSAYQLIGFTLAEFIESHGMLPTQGGGLPRVEALTLPSNSEEGAVPSEFRTPEVFTELGWAEFSQGHYEKAIEYEKQAIALNPAELRAHQILGYCYAKKGRNAEARQEWNTLKEIWTAKLENRTVGPPL